MADAYKPFSDPRAYVEYNQRLLQDKFGHDISPEYSIQDILKDPYKTSIMISCGLDIQRKFMICDRCGIIYNQDWQPLTGPNGKHGKPHDGIFCDDIGIDLYYPHEGGEVEHIRKTVVFSGTECTQCLRKNPIMVKHSFDKAITRPDEWRSSGSSKIFPEHEYFIGVPVESLVPAPLDILYRYVI